MHGIIDHNCCNTIKCNQTLFPHGWANVARRSPSHNILGDPFYTHITSIQFSKFYNLTSTKWYSTIFIIDRFWLWLSRNISYWFLLQCQGQINPRASHPLGKCSLLLSWFSGMTDTFPVITCYLCLTCSSFIEKFNLTQLNQISPSSWVLDLCDLLQLVLHESVSEPLLCFLSFLLSIMLYSPFRTFSSLKTHHDRFIFV